jgi:hypothetical protein
VIHPTNCTCGAYACQLRQKGIGYTSDVTPVMRDQRRRKWRPRVNASWEAGTAGERRPGGFFSPYIGDKTFRRIHVKEAAERRREFDATRRAQHAGHTQE